MKNQTIQSDTTTTTNKISQGVASLPTVVGTPIGTLSITLTPPPQVTVPLIGNAVIWVAILSFTGIVLSLWQAHRRTKMELAASANQATVERDQSREEAKLDRDHHSEQAHQERITKARREVYLELISEMIKAQLAIGSLPTKDIEKLDFGDDLGGLIAATSKISILGEMATVMKSRELLTAINEALFRVMALLNPLNEYRDEGKNRDKKLAIAQLEIDRLTTESNDLFEKKIYSTHSAQVNNKLKFQHERAVEHSAAAAAAKFAFAKEYRKYGTAVLLEAKIISLKVDELIYSIRTELGLSTSIEQLNATSAKMHVAAEAAGNQLYASLEQYSNERLLGLQQSRTP